MISMTDNRRLGTAACVLQQAIVTNDGKAAQDAAVNIAQALGDYTNQVANMKPETATLYLLSILIQRVSL